MKQDKRIRLLYGIILLLLLVIASFFARRIAVRMLQRWEYNTSYYEKRVKAFRTMQRNIGQILFLGDSITEGCNFKELLPFQVINRGIAGDVTFGVLNRLDEVISLRPRKLFLLIGINDIGSGIGTGAIAGNIRQIISRLHDGTPETKIYLQSLFPTRGRTERPNSRIQELNAELKDIAEEMNCTYIDLYPLLLIDGELGSEYTLDGLHLTGLGYNRWLDFLRPYLDE